MTGPGGRRVPAGYRFQVDAHLDDHWSAWFGGMTVTHDSDGTSTLSGPVADQAQLHGILAKIRDLGVTLIGVDVIDPPDDDHQPARKGTHRFAAEPGTAPADRQQSQVLADQHRSRK